MVHSPLPIDLISKLRKIAGTKHKTALRRKFMRLKNIDSRGVKEKEACFQGRLNESDFQRINLYFEQVISCAGKRVRELDVSKKYPALGKVAIKAVHSNIGRTMDAVGFVREIEERVDKANSLAEKLKASWRVKKPFIYALNNELVAMAKTSYPEVSSLKKQLAKDDKKRKEFEKNYGVAFNVFENIVDGVSSSLGLHERNILFVGKEKGKFLFIPLADLF
jgi:hypothetical protein